MKIFKTPKGTELQIMSLKGKDYMTVQQRLIWFVEENPRYDIQTVIDTSKEGYALGKCTVVIFDEDAKVIRKVTAHKTETAKDFADYVEKVESSSLGRALAMLGYGSQFAAADLDEGTRIVDSPVIANSAIKSGAVSLDRSGTSTLSATTSLLATPAPKAPAPAETATLEATATLAEKVTAMPKPKFGRKPTTTGGGPSL